MTIAQKIQAALRRTDRMCDDCLSEVTGVRPRQAINANCREMVSNALLSRAQEDCARCRRVKFVNWLRANSRTPSISRSASPKDERSAVTDKGGRPWFWEGNVQGCIVRFLREAGYEVQSEADTASRQHGKDIVARSPEGKTLWVTVKGFPERSKNVQARHWFSGALHDLARYRDESEEAMLGMGLPAGFKTYEGLLDRNKAVRKFLAYRVYWVNEDGSVAIG